LHLAFSKYHGLGNDFLVVDRRGEDLLSEEAVRRLCDRRRGVGGDGVLSVQAPRAAGATLRMRVQNSDGSMAQTCGNGIRCFALHATRTFPELAGAQELRVETDAGVVLVEIAPSALGEAMVRVNMGPATLAPPSLPVAGALAEAGQLVRAPLELEGRALSFTGVSMGNPHAVLFEGPEPAEASALGPALNRHPAFPEGVNVGFAQVREGRIELTVWERGAGLTLACGTGACAAAVAGVLEGRVPAGEEIEVRLPGGALFVEARPDLGAVWMRGPAAHVYDGGVAIEALLAREVTL